MFVAYVTIDRFTALEVESVEISEYMAPEKTYRQAESSMKSNAHIARANTGFSRKFEVFNPNTAGKEQLLRNHFPAFLADRLLKFRESGMKFRKKEDLLKIYGLRPEFYEELEAFIQLPGAEEDRNYHTFERVFEEKSSPETPAKAMVNKAPEPFDINRASIDDLTAVKGIGKVFAQRIINFRESLGGFVNMEQVKSTYGLPDSTYRELGKVIFIEQPPRRFRINEVEMEQWPKGLLKFNKRRAVLAYREQHGSFNSAEELRKVRILDETDIELLAAYADFSKP